MKILLVEDDPDTLALFVELLERDGVEIQPVSDASDALEMLGGGRDFDLILSDLQMGQVGGMELLRAAKERLSEVPFVMITGFGSTESAVEVMRAGATDYIDKPFDLEGIEIVLERAIRHGRLYMEVRELRRRVGDRGIAGIVGKSKRMAEVLDLVRRVADSDTTVLITGESGTGKEMVARAIHELSPRRDWPFLTIDCGAIPANLIESELFGHVRGAFTGADRNKPGLFETARGGTVLLDEIGELDPPLQTRLLRVLQEREYKPVGGTEAVRTEVRTLCATHVDLERAVEEKRFREDLYYRIAVVRLEVPPLRDRREDIPYLARHFAAKYSRQGQSIVPIAPEAMQLLAEHPWKGNVRELENALERAILVGSGDVVLPEHLPPEVSARSMRPEGRVRTEPLSESVRRAVEEVEREAIRRALERCGGNRSEAARLLEISRGSLYNKMEKLGLS